MELFNLPASYGSREPAKHYINHDVLHVWSVFTLCGSQWTYGPTGKRQNLIYPAAFDVARACGVRVNRTFVEYLQCIEEGALAATHGTPLSELFSDEKLQNRGNSRR